ncbi:NADP-dependent oxidoreductase domain-containing protein [Penicillium manginii]|uniref:NADP-dependent oxidoreductase domain-containing protein n=1 Tax=Penicillium manginii TaxID=203109 RepID=UPI00254868E2|nr:NADP-dependent oxidoreductase domain-containing protein [Penicillium manginii]KAJ5741369.1 NADP-dependent oxidoreductase domain-containing protein [Penicillium manginii]
MSLPLRALGRNGPQVNAVGLGLMSIGGIYGAASSTEEGVAFLEHAHATGQRFWDTADLYRTSEDIVGEWIKRTGKRNDIFLATKFACEFSDGSLKVRSDPEYVKVACERSLKKLNVETIDLYYCHRVDGVTPIEKTVEAMVELKNQGKIRYIGLSEVSAATLRRAHAVHPITALQVEYSPFALDIESPNSDVLDTCRELGISVVAYSPIGRGILTGQIKSTADFAADDFRRFLPKYAEENFPKILQLVEGLKDVAKDHNSTPTQIAIATTARMDENTASAQIQLTSEEERKIRDLIKETEVTGSRYHESMMSSILADTPPL